MDKEAQSTENTCDAAVNNKEKTMTKPTKEELKKSITSFVEDHHNAPYGYIEHIIRRDYLDCDPEAGWVDYTFTIPPEAANIIGTVHGGYIAAISDETMGITATGFMNDEDAAVTTLDYQLNTIKAMHVGDKIRMRCTVEHIGSRTVLAHAVMYRGDEITAMATENFAHLSKSKIKFVDFKTMK